MQINWHWLCFCILLTSPLVAEDAELKIAELEFFENKIRPVLLEKCVSCHNSVETAEGGLILDHRQALRTGGQSGPLLDFKSPEKSLLLRVLRHEIEDLEMPQGEEALSAATIGDFQKWITLGAPDPRQAPSTATAQVATWETIREERKQWWSFQPIRDSRPPAVENENWSFHPIDKFILAKLEIEKIAPTQVANRHTLIRRLSYVLCGLPPTPDEVKRFVEDTAPEAFEKLVDRYLASPAFGEHWARHWMDLVRYAETHGSEGDPAIPAAWKYRDYLIRAFNDDVPYDQLVKEQIAGDLLPRPRINETLQLNESAIGAAQWRMCFHGFAPTDALDEKVRFTDDQINVVSKAFLGLTVSCARCHNHKFDPISQADYYALFGIVGSTRPGIVDVNPVRIQEQHKPELQRLKSRLRDLLAEGWLVSLAGFRERVEMLLTSTPDAELNHVEHFLHPMRVMQQSQEELKSLSHGQRTSAAVQLPLQAKVWDLSQQSDFSHWTSHGNGSADHSAQPGNFSINASDAAIGPLLPGGVYSHLFSTKHRNVFCSPNIQLDGEYDLWVHVNGESEALLRYVVQNYPRSGTVYPVTTLQDGKWRWQKYDVSYWNGESLHIELTTAADSAVLAKEIDRSGFGIQSAILAPTGTFTPPENLRSYEEVFKGNLADLPTSLPTLIDRYATSLLTAIQAWQREIASNEQVALIEAARQLKLLTLPPKQSSDLRGLLRQYQQLESEIALPNRVPGVLEGAAADQALFVRGNHHQPGAVVPRRFLEVIDDESYQTEESGRLQFADDLIRRDNPLTRRVVVNRVWHYLFGAGLVRTVDNFGRLGEEPSHPELLDYLANRFDTNKWSIKALIREILLTKTWQLNTTASTAAVERDPENRRLSHANLRRLDGEAIRDTLLTLSGRLERKMFGPPSGNETEQPRRSIYLAVRRNSLNPFLDLFDFPVPAATKGRRDATNVPAQSLTMLNDPFVIQSAQQFANQTQADSEAARINALIRAALGRPASEHELKVGARYLETLRQHETEELHTRRQLEQQLATNRNMIESIAGPVRDRLMKLKGRGESPVTAETAPILDWNFSNETNDNKPTYPGTLEGNAHVENGALVLDGSSYLRGAPLEIDLTEKTFVATVQLATLQQRGGGVFTVQDLTGNVFDSLVFGEKNPGQWLAGSDNFRRTQSFAGEVETAVDQEPVQLALTYASDGTIQAYRNGIPYGTSYRVDHPAQFKAGQAQVLLGLRHGSPSGNRLLNGKIFSASLYNRRLHADEIMALSQGNRLFVSDRELQAALTSEQKSQLAAAVQSGNHLELALKAKGSAPQKDQEWADFAHAIMNFKEFLYLQ